VPGVSGLVGVQGLGQRTVRSFRMYGDDVGHSHDWCTVVLNGKHVVQWYDG